MPVNAALVFSSEFLRINGTGSMVNGQKVDAVLSNPVDKSVAADYDFSNVFDSQFWNNPA
jgi:hypothetical protein